jgi:hypothetical protein
VPSAFVPTVLDEADEMLNMGFADDIEEIFSRLVVAAMAICYSDTILSPGCLRVRMMLPYINSTDHSHVLLTAPSYKLALEGMVRTRAY